MGIAQVRALSVRPGRASAPADVDSVIAVEGYGLEGDVHADALSPRQVLLASSAAYRELGLPPHALGENLLVDLDTAQLASGTVLRIGAQVRLRMMFQCEACGQLDSAQERLAARIGARRGMLARELAGGALHPGDPIVDLGPQAPAWPDDWRQRLRIVLDAMPRGVVVEYKVLARLIGVQPSYCRAFTRVIAGLGPAYAGRAVAAQSPLALPRWTGDGLFTSQSAAD
jgi:hypothetical protein